MKLSQDFFYTIRENIKDEESISGNLLVRSGMFKKVSNGIYMKLPLGQRVANNVNDIVRKHMNLKGALEVSMPLLLPIEIFEKSGRKTVFGSSIFKLDDRYNRHYALGPTHEEFFALAAMNKAKSYKDFPYILYQIGNKYRDEIRPRLGLIRIREFTMKDAYSFDLNEEEGTKSYQKMADAYNDIFTEVGLNYVVVKADTGVMGGLLSEEFQAITDIGEDTIVLCEKCQYASNLEVSKCVLLKDTKEEKIRKIEKVYTPNSRTIDEVANFLQEEAKKFVKTLIYSIDHQLYVCLVRGNRELNEVKLQKLLDAKEINIATEEEISKEINLPIGFIGPVGLNLPIIMDNEIANMQNFIVGANIKDYHFKNVNIKDFKPLLISDIVNVQEGDLCPVCGHHLSFKKGIEVGNIFKLGTKYSLSLDLNYLNNSNQLIPVFMGSYGIGIERIIAAIVEQNHDEKGIVWPINISPFKVAIVVANMKDSLALKKAEELYEKLNRQQIDTILDDREVSIGVKFNDMDLIGIPIRITIGKNINDNLVEFKLRKAEEIDKIKYEEIIEKIKKHL